MTQQNIKPFFRYIGLFVFPIIMVAFSACADYLDVVPDKTQEVELLFERKATAQGALAACYSFLPQSDVVYLHYSFDSEEIVAPLLQTNIPGREIIRGKQNPTSPIMGYWDDFNAPQSSQESLFKAIRYCNTFIDNIDQVLNMEYREKQEWKSEAIFLKAYYHFLLLSQYGPVPIVDQNLPIDAEPEEVRIKREPVDSVVNYIVRTIDLAREQLPQRYSDTEAGRVDQVVAAAIKSRVLLYAASPLFNGNAAFYDRFRDKEGHLFFNIEEDKHKWELAANASEEAIAIALRYAGLYTHDSIANPILPSDSAIYQTEEKIRALYNYRYMMTDPWNKELIWGRAFHTGYWRIQAAAFPMSTAITTSQGAAWSWAAPTLDMAEAYYTKNGLPIDADKTFDYERRYGVGRISGDDTLFVEQGSIIPRLHQNREVRFYASLAFDRSYFRIWDDKWTMRMRLGEANGKQNTGDYSPTGYILKKVQHLKAKSDSYANLNYYPWPIIRMAELYLNYAEALNEWEGPSQKVYDALNEVRSRVSLPKVEDVWGDPDLVTPEKLNSHKTPAGMREIIHAERRIELAFEGNRNFDVRRWKEGDKYFKKEVLGWSVEQSSATNYYQLTPVFLRSFITPRDYLHPIKHDELQLNSNLVQNPGW
jgi:hypothetical protein